MGNRKLVWVGSSKKDLKSFPEEARRSAGFELFLVEIGDEPSDFKPMKSVGSGVYEIRVREEGRAFRVLYVAKFEEAVYVLHAFEKKTRKTPQKDIELARARYKEVVRKRSGR